MGQHLHKYPFLCDPSNILAVSSHCDTVVFFMKTQVNMCLLYKWFYRGSNNNTAINLKMVIYLQSLPYSELFFQSNNKLLNCYKNQIVLAYGLT